MAKAPQQRRRRIAPTTSSEENGGGGPPVVNDPGRPHWFTGSALWSELSKEEQAACKAAALNRGSEQRPDLND